MLILLSPTKQMKSEPLHGSVLSLPVSSPLFQKEADLIHRSLLKLSPEDLGQIMKTGEILTVQTMNLLRRFGDRKNPATPALFAYSGTVFRELDPFTLDRAALDYGQKHLRILSGMYGILRAFDRIYPYRLEVKTPFAPDPCRNLYQFWQEPLAQYLVEEPILQSGGIILNLASQEYSRMVDRESLPAKTITLHFKEETLKGPKTRGMYAKMARGKTLRKILIDRIQDPEKLKFLDPAGYRYSNNLSTAQDWIFIRPRER